MYRNSPRANGLPASSVFDDINTRTHRIGACGVSRLQRNHATRVYRPPRGRHTTEQSLRPDRPGEAAIDPLRGAESQGAQILSTRIVVQCVGYVMYAILFGVSE
jgi:hypothetical protein